MGCARRRWVPEGATPPTYREQNRTQIDLFSSRNGIIWWWTRPGSNRLPPPWRVGSKWGAKRRLLVTWWWTRPGSNRLPPPCHGGALPSELRALVCGREGAARNFSMLAEGVSATASYPGSGGGGGVSGLDPEPPGRPADPPPLPLRRLLRLRRPDRSRGAASGAPDSPTRGAAGAFSRFGPSAGDAGSAASSGRGAAGTRPPSRSSATLIVIRYSCGYAGTP